MARIHVTQYEEAEGRLKEIYDDLIQKRGKLADVHMIQSLRPESIVKHMELYLEIMFSKSELSRAEREMIAVVVSASNQCEYCQQHHGEALNHYWKNEDRLLRLRSDFRNADLSEREQLLCAYAQKLTLHPGVFTNDDGTSALKEVGISDSAILDATLVVAYFNFVNRIVQGLGVQLEEDAGNGYNY
ncbi:MAG: peroxidase-related enzyme [Bacteroidia bacterium]|nr:peroxidase-related enzyme [Bacteroidia bacterium]